MALNAILGGIKMSTKWTREEFEAKRNALEDRKRKKKYLRLHAVGLHGLAELAGNSARVRPEERERERER